MNTVTYETENALFFFDRAWVKEELKSRENIEEKKRLLAIISSSSPKETKIDREDDFFAFVALDLINKRLGSVSCKICSKTYCVGDLIEISVGHGKSPLNLKKKGVIKDALAKGVRPAGMFGGYGFSCPEGHELIAVMTWIT